ncbi:MAG: hypothetical protein H6744_18970 [Deltaproteobacteria bacterium]|nr:hypothetical protein [Deltaproteobacteria bacterium]MCB9788765.1 hypothetical protein [Deltaproteobacteria bacterium]
MLLVLRGLLVIAILAAVAVALRRAGAGLRRRRRRAPAEWRALARGEARLAQALDLRERLASLASRRSTLVDESLVEEVDQVLEPLVDLASLRRELDQHLRGLDPEATAREAAALGPERASRVRSSVEALIARRDRLAAQEVEVVAGLREIYLDLLDGVTGGASELASAADRTRSLGESVRLRVESEREVRALLAAD